MTARPDVPDTPDRTDAVARYLMACEQAHEEAGAEAWPETDDYARWLLTTDDPAAVAALLATLAERHPDALLTALTNAGEVCKGCDSLLARCMRAVLDEGYLKCCPDCSRRTWREVQQP